MDHSVYIALGANLGDCRATLTAAVDMLDGRSDISIVAVSSFVQTKPVGPAQPDYINAAAELRTTLTPAQLLDVLHGVEAAFGRDRSKEVRWGPRHCDLDIIFYDDIVIDTPLLTIPHKLMHTRSFVLGPLAELAADKLHPQLGLSVGELLEKLGSSGDAREQAN